MRFLSSSDNVCFEDLKSDVTHSGSDSVSQSGAHTGEAFAAASLPVGTPYPQTTDDKMLAPAKEELDKYLAIFQALSLTSHFSSHPLAMAFFLRSVDVIHFISIRWHLLMPILERFWSGDVYW